MPFACDRRNSVQLGPVRRGGGTRSRGPEQAPDRGRRHADPELAELATDPDAAPAGVLPGQPEDELTDLGIDRRPSRPTGPAVRPLPPHELAMPPEEGRRSDEEGDPTVARERPTGRREEDPVDGPELGSARLPLQHSELMRCVGHVCHR